MGKREDDVILVSASTASPPTDVGTYNPLNEDEGNEETGPPSEVKIDDADIDCRLDSLTPYKSSEFVDEVGWDELGPSRPRLLEWVVGGPKAFAVWSMLYLVMKVAAGLYIGAVISNIEKQFQLSSTESGAILILNDALDLALAMFVAYFGQKGHRPRIIAVGTLLAGIGLILCGMPHVMLDPYTSVPQGCNETAFTADYCVVDGGPEDPCSVSFRQPAFNPVAFLIIGQVLLGIGNVPVKPLSTTYIDDAVSKHVTPIYMSFLLIGSSAGPIIGLALSTSFLGIFVDFDRVAFEDQPAIDETDPRFIGAWWLGFILLGCAVILLSIPFFFFPRHLPKTKVRLEEDAEKEKKELEAQGISGMEMEALPNSEVKGDVGNEPNEKVQDSRPFYMKWYIIIRDMLLTYKKLVTNLALVLMCLSTALAAADAAANSSFALKYYTIMFDMPASMASTLGMVLLPVMMGGILVGGFVIRRWKLSPASCALINVFGDVLAVVIIPAFITLGCPTRAVAGVSTPYEPPAPYSLLPMMTGPIPLPDSAQQAQSPCNTNCTCSDGTYNPVCGSDGITYVSGCYAGCEVVESSKDDEGRTVYSFSDCRCINATVGMNSTATDGECPGTCDGTYLTLMIIAAIIQYFSSALGRTGLIIITIRIVGEELRATAIGFQTAVSNLLGFFPAPIYFGAVINAACILWGYENGERGACWLYDNDTYRYGFQGLAGGLRFISAALFLSVYIILRKNKKPESEDQPKEKEAQIA